VQTLSGGKRLKKRSPEGLQANSLRSRPCVATHPASQLYLIEYFFEGKPRKKSTSLVFAEVARLGAIGDPTALVHDQSTRLDATTPDHSREI
jgi:hypothetical protein